jgi:hypothetical protein
MSAEHPRPASSTSAQHTSPSAYWTCHPGETVFFARGAHRSYTLTAQPGSSSWVVVVIGGDHAPRTFTGLAQGIDHILDELETAGA